MQESFQVFEKCLEEFEMKMYKSKPYEVPLIKWNGAKETLDILDSILIGKIKGVFEPNGDMLIRLRSGSIRVELDEYIEIISAEEFHVYSDQEFNDKFKEI